MSEICDDFWTRYSNMCLKAKVCPLKSVIKHLKGTELCCPVEAIRAEHWQFLLSALSVDNSLTKVHFLSTGPSPYDQYQQYKRKKRREKDFPIPYGRTPKNIGDICSSLADLLRVSQTLNFLKLENLKFKKVDVEVLAEGLKSSNLEQLSLAGCNLDDNAVEAICRGLRDTNTAWLDLSSCGLTETGVDSLCGLIKTHRIRRSNEMFKSTLRYQLPVLDSLKGLSRISLNDNKLGDDGIGMIVECLDDDLWIKALDLQKCRIGNDGAEFILNLAKSNAEIEIIDVRLNDIEESMLQRISHQLILNRSGKIIKYGLMPLLLEEQKLVKRVPKSKITSRMKACKRLSPSKGKLLRNGSKSEEDIAKKSNETSFQKSVDTEDVYVQTLGSFEDLTRVHETLVGELRKQKKALSDEMKLRLKLSYLLVKCREEKQYLQEEFRKFSSNDNLVFIDHETFTEVKRTFEKFKKFLDIMKEYGLWEFIAMLGVNEKAEVVLRRSPDESRKYMKIVETSHSAESGQESSDSSSQKYPQPIPARRPCSCNCSKVGCKAKERLIVKGEKSVPDSKPPCQTKAVQTSTAQVFGKSQGKNLISGDKASAQKVFKDVHDSFNKSSQSNQPTPSTKPSAEKPDDRVSANPLCKYFSEVHVCLRKVPESDIPSKLKKFKSPTEFYSTVKKELDKCDNLHRSKNVATSTSAKTTAPSNSHGSDSGKSTRRNFPLEAASPAPHLSLTRLCKDASKSDHSPFPLLPNHMHYHVPPHRPLSMEDFISAGNILQESGSEPVPRKLLKNPPKDASTASNSGQRKQSHSPSCWEEQMLLELPHDLISPKRLPSAEFTPRKKNNAQSSLSKNGSVKSGNSKKSQEISLQSSCINSSTSVASSNGSVQSTSNKKEARNVSVNSSSSKNTNDQEIGNKSYLESVSDASTDKDVKSFSEIEVSPALSEKESDSKHSKTSVNSNHSSNSSKRNRSRKKTSQKRGDLMQLKNAGGGDQPPAALPADQLPKKDIETFVPDHKAINKKMLKSGASDSSVPSLSDITTVSSHSLNTDSVMNQLSEKDF